MAHPTPEAFLAPFPDHLRELAEHLRALVTHSVPNVTEQVYPGWRLIGYRVGYGRSSAYFCFIAPMSDHVRLGFEYGAWLSDKQRLLEGQGKQVRYISLQQRHEPPDDALSALLADAALLAIQRRAG